MSSPAAPVRSPNELLAKQLIDCAVLVKKGEQGPLLEKTLQDLTKYVKGAPKPKTKSSSKKAHRRKSNDDTAAEESSPKESPVVVGRVVQHGSADQATWYNGHEKEGEWCEEHFCQGCSCKQKKVKAIPVASSARPRSKPAFHRPTNPKSPLVANGWIEQSRRSKMRTVWKQVLASVVEGRKPGEETTLWVQREVVTDGKHELEALHQLPIKWVQEVTFHSDPENRFSIKVYNFPEDFVFRCPNNSDAAQNWVLTLRSMKEIAERPSSRPPPKSPGTAKPTFEDEKKAAENNPKSPSKPPPQQRPEQATPFVPSEEEQKPPRMSVKELRAVAHGAGIKTIGMERGELEAIVFRIASGQPVNMNRSSTPPLSHAAEKETSEGTKSPNGTLHSVPSDEQEAENKKQNEEEKKEEEARKKEELRKAEKEEAAKRRAFREEAEKRRLADEEAKKKAAEEEEARKKQAEEEHRRATAERVKKQQEQERLRQEEEERQALAAERKKKDEEEYQRRVAEQRAAEARRQQEEAARLQQQRYQQQQEAWRKQQEAEAERARQAQQQQAEEARRRHEAFLRQQQQQQPQQNPFNAQQPHQQQYGQQQYPHQWQQWYQQQHHPQSHHPHNNPHMQQPGFGPQQPFQHGQPGGQQPPNGSPQSAKYANMAQHQGVGSTQAIKHGILVEWALQPPHFQILRPIEDLLLSMHTVFPPRFGVPGHDYFRKWTPVTKDDLSLGPAMGHKADNEKLKKIVRKQLRFFLHPDKLPKDLSEGQSFMCKLLWDICNDAWDEHQRQEEDLGWIRS